tara:strand:+ start:10804 stop:11877 length:1074 start_codon:yes stop_codon:yes gene_type:complete
MRKGKNPYKTFGEGKAILRKPITVSMLTFIPNFSGYYKDRFKILKLSLGSLINTTDKEKADILVFDNGSCKEVTLFLQNLLNEKQINFLILSTENLGYNAALNEIYNFCTGTYLSYSDDDVYYHNGWLEAALKIHKEYPSIGFVSCSPTKAVFKDDHFFSSNLAKNFPSLVQEFHDHQLWNSNWDTLFLNSIGSIELLPTLKDISIPLFKNNNEVLAFPVSTHFHYILNRRAIDLLYPYPVGDLMSSNPVNTDFNMTIQLNKRLEDNNLARLSTDKMYTEHLGNIWSERAEKLTNNRDNYLDDNFSLTISKRKFSLFQKLQFKLMNIPKFGKIPLVLYNWSFNIIGEKTLYDKQKQK